LFKEKINANEITASVSRTTGDNSSRNGSSRMVTNADRELEQALFSSKYSITEPNQNKTDSVPIQKKLNQYLALKSDPNVLKPKEFVKREKPFSLDIAGVLSGHRSSVDCLEFDEEKGMLWSGSHDYAIRVLSC
jgi:hypothetical protein